MGAGNTRFADMERYSPETYYIEAYDYETNWDYVIENLIERTRDELKDLGFVPEDPFDLKPSDNVDMCGFREEALVLFGHEYAQICIDTESTSDKIVLSMVPLDYTVYIDLCDYSKSLSDKLGYPYNSHDTFYQIESMSSEEEFNEFESKVKESYDNYIKNIFKPLNDKVIRILYDNYKGYIYFPCGAWCSGKLELKDED